MTDDNNKALNVYGKWKKENGYSLENFHGSMLVDLYCQSTRPQLWKRFKKP